MSPFVERGICSFSNLYGVCNELAVGKAWDTTREDRPNYYCRKHLERAKKLGFSIKLFSETDIVYDEKAKK